MAAHIIAAQREAADEAGFAVRAVAVFVGGPKNRQITMSPAERIEMRELIEKSGLRVIAHSSYGGSPWETAAGSDYVRSEIAVCREAGIEGLVVHLPKLPLPAVLAALPRFVVAGVTVYLETPAIREADSMYESPAKLGALFRAIASDHACAGLAGQIGLCVDTAHLWTNGVQAVRARESMARWLAGLAEAGVPVDRMMFHLNDSERPCGVGPDTHAPLGLGRIWEKTDPADSGIAAVLEFARARGAPVILERKPKESLPGDYRVLLRLEGDFACAPT